MGGNVSSPAPLSESEQSRESPITAPALETKPSSESEQSRGSPITPPAPVEKPKKKICCACPETKKLRDECIVENGEDACAKWIEAHRMCLRAEGFNV